ncbi:endothelin receptor type B-like [Lethenteron reissneri]|uniref:endothelin receptor type B-like n=1 Tax=Lethenteron reissneri TaxID=7753 RepID=UPI002AB6143A|nr:endothelin receptor type B-like [Lethenteron reissneri]
MSTPRRLTSTFLCLSLATLVGLASVHGQGTPPSLAPLEQSQSTDAQTIPATSPAMASSSPPPPPSSSSSSFSASPPGPRAGGRPPPCLAQSGVGLVFKRVNAAVASVVFLVGSVGNSALLLVVYGDKSMMRDGSSVLIASLALGDLLYIVLDMPINVYKLHAESWPFGATVCKTVPFVQKASLGISALSLCVLSGDRYRAVAHWDRLQGVGLSLLTALKVLAIWTLSLVLAVPELLAFDTLSWEYRNRTLDTCMVIPQTSFVEFYAKAKDWWLFGFYFCMPLACAAVFYTLTTVEMLGMKKRNLGSAIDEHLKQQREAGKAVFCLAVVFALCWLPLHLSRILKRTVYDEMDPNRCELLRVNCIVFA